jgi:hypothetical protein
MWNITKKTKGASMKQKRNITMQLPVEIYEEVGKMASMFNKSRTQVFIDAWNYYRMGQFEEEVKEVQKMVANNSEQIINQQRNHALKLDEIKDLLSKCSSNAHQMLSKC